jgi:hypothetical protein
MHSLINAGITVLDVAFAAGMIGSAVVAVLTTLEDLQTMFGHEDKP